MLSRITRRSIPRFWNPIRQLQTTCRQNDSEKLEKARSLIQNRYKIFKDSDSEVIHDQTIDLDLILNQKQPRTNKLEQSQEFARRHGKNISDLRGKEGVFDIDEMVKFLEGERLTDIAVISVPKHLNYCQFIVVCTAKSAKHIKVPFCRISVLLLTILVFAGRCHAGEKRPNILIIVADDLGYGDLSIQGNRTLYTPHIDSIGRDGAVLSHHLTAASVCTPSRSAFMTGRYPIRSGMTASGKNRVFLFVAQTGGLPANETTFVKSLQKAKYRTGLVGKWHLGKDCSGRNDNCHHPNKHGFDYFYGSIMTNLKDNGNDGASVILTYFPQYYWVILITAWLGVSVGFFLGVKKWKHTSRTVVCLFIIIPVLLTLFQKNIKLLNAILFRNDEVIEQPIEFDDLTARIVAEAKHFIQNATESSLPFLLVVNFLKVHTAHFNAPQFYQTSLHGKYGDAVLEMDDSVGKILKHLKELNVEDNTLVYFTSDNGGHLEEVNLNGEPEGGSNGIFRGGKGHGAMEGGIRVPALIKWPNKIQAGQNITSVTSQMDMFRTLHAVAGQRVPDDLQLDGKNILPLLRGESNVSPHKILFHYCGTLLHGVRWIEDELNVWKVYYYTPKYKPGQEKCQFVCMCYGYYVNKHTPPLIFNIAQDPTEQYALESGSAKFRQIVSITSNYVEEHRASLTDVPSQFSFWNSVWKPWLQPCCTFPFCRCTEKNKLIVS